MSNPQAVKARILRAMSGREPFCCDAGAVAWPDHCPWHDTWRHVAFIQPPPIPHNDQEDDL